MFNRDHIKDEQLARVAANVLERVANDPCEPAFTTAQRLGLTISSVRRCYEYITSSKALTHELRSRFSNHYNRLHMTLTIERAFWTSILMGDDPLPQEVEWHPGTRCPLDCYFCCSAGSYSDQGYFRRAYECVSELGERQLHDRLHSLLASFAAAGTHTLQISGGKEPLSSPLALGLARLGTQLGLRTRLNTNGVLLADAPTLPDRRTSNESTLHEYARYFQQIAISIEAADRDTYNRIKRPKQRRECFECVCANIASLRQLRDQLGTELQIEVVTLVLPENIERLSDIANLFIRLGADRVRFRRLKSEGLGHRYPFGLMEQSDLMSLLTVVDKRPDVLVNWEDFRAEYANALCAPHVCWSSKRKIVVNPYGVVAPCALRSYPGCECVAGRSTSLGNILEFTNASEFWHSTQGRRHALDGAHCGAGLIADRFFNLYIDKIASDWQHGIPLSSQPFAGCDCARGYVDAQ
jgi:MoaA/NifB/PqqE/SkfB family radical SAM enzyme